MTAYAEIRGYQYLTNYPSCTSGQDRHHLVFIDRSVVRNCMFTHTMMKLTETFKFLLTRDRIAQTREPES